MPMADWRAAYRCKASVRGPSLIIDKAQAIEEDVWFQFPKLGYVGMYALSCMIEASVTRNAHEED